MKVEAFKHYNVTYFYFKPEEIFLEDTTINLAAQFDQGKLREIVYPIHNLLQEIRMFEWHLDERDKMLHYFLEKYGEGSSVSILTFYEDYYREFKKPEAENYALKKADKSEEEMEKGMEINLSEDINTTNNHKKIVAFTNQRIEERRKNKNAWSDRFAAIMKDDWDGQENEINLSLQHIKSTNDFFADKTVRNKYRCSYGMFVQFFIDKKRGNQEKLMAVLNLTVPGFGKYLSRFLHIFDPVITTDIRTWNQSSNQEHLYVENCDGSFFNANLHPALMPFEIWMPGGQNSLPEQQQIPITELEVSVNEKDNQLQIIHKPSHKRVYIFDLGFQGHNGRSQLFQLLETFTLVEYSSYNPLVQVINGIQRSRKQENKKGIWIHPRIIYEDQIILQRKAWFIPKEILPLKKTRESQWSYFARINEWKLEYDIPDEVFIFITDRHRIKNVTPDNHKKLSRDDYKPQYISFRNPFLVDLFGKLMDKVPDNLKIEEMLPKPGQLLSINDNRYATEFLVQWYG